MTVSDWMAIAREFDTVNPAATVIIKVEPGSQREPGSITVTVNQT
jgi:hypothetical protein